MEHNKETEPRAEIKNLSKRWNDKINEYKGYHKGGVISVQHYATVMDEIAKEIPKKT